MGNRVIFQKLLFLWVLFVGTVLIIHTFLVEVMRKKFFVGYMFASSVSAVLLMTSLYIIVKFDKQIEQHISAFLYLSNKRRAKKNLLEATTDKLTGLYDYEYFMMRLGEEMERAKRYSRPFSLIMIGVDNFNDYNDRFGRLQGDELLQRLGDVFKRFIKKVDIAGRYDNGKFTIALPETNKDEAVLLSERLRKYVEVMKFQDGRSVTISVGISFFDGSNIVLGIGPGAEENADFTKEDFIKAADDVLRRAGEKGTNRVEAN